MWHYYLSCAGVRRELAAYTLIIDAGAGSIGRAIPDRNLLLF